MVELLGRALHVELAVFDEAHLVDVLDARQVVGHPDNRLVMQHVKDRVQQVLLRNRVQTDRRLIQDDDRRVLQQDASQRQPLALPAREPATGLLHLGIVPVRKTADQVVQFHGLDHPADVFIRRLEVPQPHVVHHCGIKEVRLLVQHAEKLRALVLQPRDRHVVQRNLAAGRLLVAQDQLQQGTLPRPTRAQQGQLFPRFDGQRQVGNDLPLRPGVGEVQVVHPQRRRRLNRGLLGGSAGVFSSSRLTRWIESR